MTKTEVHDGYSVTRFPCGRDLFAAHEEQPGQRATAVLLGYATVEHMNREHDLVHSMLAQMLGLPHSPALYAAAGGEDHHGAEVYGLEEDAVKAIQRYARSLGLVLA